MRVALLEALPLARLPSGDLIPTSAYARHMYQLIDAEALRVGETLKAQHPDWPQDPQAPRDPRWLAIPALRAWAAAPGGIGNTWVNWYVVLLTAHIDFALRTAQKAG